MESINRNDNGDVHCRYKMASLEAKSDTRSKQRRTWLSNVVEVCDNIHRPVPLLFQWFQLKGVIGGCDRSSGTARWFVKGHHDQEALRQMTRDFCSQLVVCPKCTGIDTYLYTINNGSKKKPSWVIKIACDTSAHPDASTHVQDAKLAKHIPEKAEAVGESLGAMGLADTPVMESRIEKSDDDLAASLAKYQRKLAKAERKGDEEEVARYANKVMKIEAKLAGSAGSADHDEDEEEEWSTDVSAAAVAARAEKRGRL